MANQKPRRGKKSKKYVTVDANEYAEFVLGRLLIHELEFEVLISVFLPLISNVTYDAKTIKHLKKLVEKVDRLRANNPLPKAIK